MMPARTNDITWKIGGEAGFGIMSTGEMFARICMRAGLNVFSYPEYPSLIRGGHNTDQVTASAEPLTSHRTSVSILVALNRETIDLHLSEMSPNGVIIYDTTDTTFAKFDPSKVSRRDVLLFGLPLEDLAKKSGGEVLMRNTVALGASCALLDIPLDNLNEVIDETFGKKGDEVIKLNADVLASGYKAATSAQRKSCPWQVTPAKTKDTRVLLTGNDALALGAIQAGCQFFSAYPMTPATSILHFLAQHGPGFGMVVRHSEDEIAAVNNAIGAAYAGVRAMTATSGGGFSLMTEAVGLAAMTEVGIVIIDAQRPGPSTGMPTWTEQGDLRQVLHASQGDFPRIVLAPTSHAECFTLIQHAFNLADVYQTPVIVLTDKYLAEGRCSVAVKDLKTLPIKRGKVWKGEGTYLRYRERVTDGICPRAIPGTPKGLFLANSDEHDEYGFSNEDKDHRIAQMERRARKVATLRKKTMPPRIIGAKKASLTVVTWGSSAGPVEMALATLKKNYGKTANAVVVPMVAPLPVKVFMAAMKKAKKTVIVESNRSGKFAGFIREYTGFTPDHSIRRYDGRPFDPDELAKELALIARKK
ncbi:MAG: 2-oxoacid:acceptor oxidoreductase subunit alpha [Candidatus Kerfeldbacteria bacterium]